MALARLTQLRQAVWDSINGYEPLRTIFLKKFRHEQTHALNKPNPEPSIGQLPSIEVRGGIATTAWANNQQQEITYAISLIIHTAHLDYRSAERIWELVIRSLWQSKPEGSSLTYLERLSGFQNNIASFSSTLTPGVVEAGSEVMRNEMTLSLKMFWNPRTETTDLEI